MKEWRRGWWGQAFLVLAMTGCAPEKPAAAPLEPEPHVELPPREQPAPVTVETEFRGCYELGLGRDANLAGKVVARFVIGRDGRVASVQAGETTDLKDQEVVRCTLEALKTVVFPEPEGGIVSVVYPILFEPADG